MPHVTAEAKSMTEIVTDGKIKERTRCRFTTRNKKNGLEVNCLGLGATSAKITSVLFYLTPVETHTNAAGIVRLKE